MTPIRVLLVDDEQASAEALAQRMVKLGYQVSLVLGGEEALRFLAEDRSKDVVLLNVKMPALDGLEALRRIKALQPLVETIILSADTDVATAVKAMHFGAWDYLLKPCDFSKLAATIEAAARQKRDRERKVLAIHMRPYISSGEKEELIASILAS